MSACRFDSQPLFEPPRAGTGDGSPDAGALPSPLAGNGSAGVDGRDNEAGALPPPVGGQDDAAITPVVDAGPPDAGPVSCTPHELTGCADGAATACRADGLGFERIDCGDLGCDAVGLGCNACRPQQRSCRGNSLIMCGPDGQIAQEEVCPASCREGPGGQAACSVCTPGTSMCVGDEVMRCDADAQWRTERCADGCDETIGLCQGGRVVPSNLPNDTCAAPTGAERDIESDLEIDTDSNCSSVVTQTDGMPAICVLVFGELRIREGVTVRVTGSRALALVATHSLRVEGTLSVSARGASEGPGSAAGGMGVGGTAVGRLMGGVAPGQWVDLPANAAGGGGGHATLGAPGGGAPGQCGPGLACTAAGGGGEVYGNDVLVPLIGGAAGGRNSAASWSSRHGEPGGGGGALELVGCEELELGEHAIIEAGGGGGGGGSPGTEDSDSDTPGAGAGGGSGGAILIQARVLTVTPGAMLVANGGGGGGGASRGNGPAAADARAGGQGQDGQRGSTPAAGGLGAGTSMTGGGGGALIAPGAGGSAERRAQAAGGGGGSAGRIRIELAGGQLDLNDLVVSPAATVGRVGYE